MIDKNNLLLGLPITALSPLAMADVVLKKVLDDSPNNESTKEYVELYQSSSVTDLFFTRINWLGQGIYLVS
jgi:hypothetical protein